MESSVEYWTARLAAVVLTALVGTSVDPNQAVLVVVIFVHVQSPAEIVMFGV
jgi:hypothetical protein